MHRLEFQSTNDANKVLHMCVERQPFVVPKWLVGVIATATDGYGPETCTKSREYPLPRSEVAGTSVHEQNRLPLSLLDILETCSIDRNGRHIRLTSHSVLKRRIQVLHTCYFSAQAINTSLGAEKPSPSSNCFIASATSFQTASRSSLERCIITELKPPNASLAN